MKFVLGLAVGVMLAVIFAPASGEETRQELASKVRDIAESKERKLEQKAGELGSRVGRQAAEAAVAAMANKVVPGSGDKPQSR